MIIAEGIQMIADSFEMKSIEKQSGHRTSVLMKMAAEAIAAQLQIDTVKTDRILIIAGKGNNGGDGLSVCRLLKDRKCKVYLAEGKPAGKESLEAFCKLSPSVFIQNSGIRKAIDEADVIIDAVYGFGYHGSLNPEIKKLFKYINAANAKVISIDINSGCEADSGHCDSAAIHSDITYALDCLKPFHLLQKDHQLFDSVCCLDLHLPHPEYTKWHEMDEDRFFLNFPQRKSNAYKGSNGKTLLIGGSGGMAGALGLNIIGAKTVGTAYLQAALPEEIYPILASRFLTTVFHPFTDKTYRNVLEPLVTEASAVGFGSGAVYMPHVSDCLDLVLQNSSSPIVLDAEALRLLKHNTYILRFAKAPVILTPHIGEFADLINQPAETIMDHKVEAVRQFARDYKVIVCLKGPHTVVASPAGDCYINQTGNQALATAGSGDLLTGIMTGILSLTRDVYTAAIMAVWLHGYLADLGTINHCMQTFDLESYPSLMNALFTRHNY